MSIKINIQNLSKSLKDKTRYFKFNEEEIKFNKFGETKQVEEDGVLYNILLYGNKNQINYKVEYIFVDLPSPIVELTPPPGKNFLNIENDDRVLARTLIEGVVQNTRDLKFLKNGEVFELFANDDNGELLVISYTADLFTNNLAIILTISVGVVSVGVGGYFIWRRLRNRAGGEA